MVLWVDEESQIQAFDRTQPMLPMRPGQAERCTHGYSRYGTASPFAALEVATGRSIGAVLHRHRSVECRRFLDRIEESVPENLGVHLIPDTYGTHKTTLIRNWLAKRRRLHLHFAPTGASWMNLVERFFGLFSEKQVRGGSQRSTWALEPTIRRHIDIHNRKARSLVGPKAAEQTFGSRGRPCSRISDSGHWYRRKEKGPDPKAGARGNGREED